MRTPVSAVILSCHHGEETARQTIQPRFNKMIQALKQGGIVATHLCVGNADDLVDCLQRERPSIVFSAAHYMQDQVNIHAILENLDQPYIGSNSETIELALSKAALKDHWRRHGILTPDYYVIKKTFEGKVLGLDDLARAEDFPYIVKPSKEGNSRGLREDSIVFDKTELDRLVARLLDEYDELLVEQYLGRYSNLREFTVAMIGNGSNALVMPAEIIIQTPRRWRIITTSDKDEHHTLAAPVIDKELSLKVEQQARQALLAAEVQDYARCDMLMAEGKLFAIEINGQPMIPDKWFAACAHSEKMGDAQYINAIFLAGMVRHMRQKVAKNDIPVEMQMLLPEQVYDRLCDGIYNDNFSDNFLKEAQV